MSTSDGKRAHDCNRHIILTPAAIQTNRFNVRRPLYIMTSHPWAGYVIGEDHILSMPYSFPSLAAHVRGRGRHQHERWVLIVPETEGKWNLWMVFAQHCTNGYWLVLDIVPWWGMWSELYYNSKESTDSEQSTHSEEVSSQLAIIPPAEAEPVECQSRRVRFTIDGEV